MCVYKASLYTCTYIHVVVCTACSDVLNRIPSGESGRKNKRKTLLGPTSGKSSKQATLGKIFV